jgi:hypothetical protein
VWVLVTLLLIITIAMSAAPLYALPCALYALHGMPHWQSTTGCQQPNAGVLGY